MTDVVQSLWLLVTTVAVAGAGLIITLMLAIIKGKSND